MTSISQPARASGSGGGAAPLAPPPSPPPPPPPPRILSAGAAANITSVSLAAAVATADWKAAAPTAEDIMRSIERSVSKGPSAVGSSLTGGRARPLQERLSAKLLGK
jgi:hypothetical protein